LPRARDKNDRATGRPGGQNPAQGVAKLWRKKNSFFKNAWALAGPGVIGAQFFQAQGHVRTKGGGGPGMGEPGWEIGKNTGTSQSNQKRRGLWTRVFPSGGGPRGKAGGNALGKPKVVKGPGHHGPGNDGGERRGRLMTLSESWCITQGKKNQRALGCGQKKQPGNFPGDREVGAPNGHTQPTARGFHDAGLDECHQNSRSGGGPNRDTGPPPTGVNEPGGGGARANIPLENKGASEEF